MKKYRKGLAAIVFAVLLVSLSACASKKLTVNEAEVLVRAEMQEIFQQEQESEKTGSYEIHVLKNTSQVTVKSIEMDGKSAVAVCQIRSLDLHSALSALLESMKNQQVGVSAYEEMLKEAVDNAEYTEAEYEIALSCGKDGGWAVSELPYDVYDAYLGGYLTFVQDAMNAFVQEVTE